MKIFLFIVSVLFFVEQSSSQTLLTKVPLKEQIKSSTLVIEGKVIGKKSFWDTKRKNIYTSNTVEIYKSFKGDLLSTIEVITIGGRVGLEMQKVTPSLQLSKGDIGMFFLKKTPNKVNSKSDELSYMSYSGVQGFYKYDLHLNQVSNPFYNKNEVNEFYKDIVQVSQKKYNLIRKFKLPFTQNSNKSGSITSFTPTTANAGTKTVITINGSGFGATQGSVQFSNADDGGATFISGIANEIVSWSDTQIQVQVPAKAGTGLIRVNGTITSASNLNVPYAVINVSSDAINSGTFITYRTQHVNDDSNGGYTWQMFTDFYNNTAARGSFLRALDTWRCESGINWRFGEITTTDAVASDGINIVRFDNGSELPNGTLGRCTSRFSGCFINGGTELEWYVSELDIVFDDGQNWAYSGTPTASQYDFESVAVHELGHAHQLGHVIDNSKIMHYALSNGSFNRTLSSDDIAGAANVQNLSTTSTVCSRPLMTNFNCNTWQGTTSTLWNIASNWSSNAVPGTNTKVTVGSATNQPTISNGLSISIPDIEIESSGNLTIDSGASLTISSSLTNNSGTIIMNSNASSNGSLISQTVANGNVTYNKYVGNNWHLVGSPTVGETIEDIITNGSLASGSGGNLGLSSYNNSFFDTDTKSWQYVTASSTGSLSSGQGYALLRTTAGTVPFVGAIQTENLTYSIVQGSQNSWNLLANPYLSSIAINSNASSNNLLTQNASELDPLFVALYIWNSNTSNYDVINQTNNASYLKPGDGFFVHSKSGGGNFSFTKNMQSHQVNLGKTSSSQEVELIISDKDSEKTTKIKYLPNATVGIDVGYDAGLFNAVSSTLNIFSYLPDENIQTPLMLQCLPNFDYDKVIIPLGLIADRNKELSFSINRTNLPQELFVYLEDRTNSKIIDLSNSQTPYKISIDNEDLAKNGRFFLRVTQSALNTSNIIIPEKISVYNTKENILKLNQLQFENTELKIFNSLGANIYQKHIEKKDQDQISLKDLPIGLYVVVVKTNSRSISKKVIINKV